MRKFIELGKRIYNTSNPREVHRLIVFVGRCMAHYSAMKKFMAFFQQDELRRKIITDNPFPLEQATRAFFFAGSTFAERVKIISNHFLIEQKYLTPDWFVRLNTDEHYKIWQSNEHDINWYTILHMAPGQRKEGLMAVNMHVDMKDNPIYQIMFWLNTDKNGDESMWIGAMQGPNVANANEIIKDITKRSHRYRTKNLILYMTMAVARSFNCKHIYAVSNDGYYAMNHIRRDRKLKTDFGAFWEEAGGHKTDDHRFYEIPLIEPRKTMEEVPTRKRAVYRKRFAFQDDVDIQIETNMQKIMRKVCK
ncbi:VirK/YbjX family protein [Selenomonas sp. AE3005]|uniref:VirK/YbjX family protein n=1 Tax=Selenomonas sp. AE3005 TaxID=1485543 RepID=UPI0025D6ED86|nr:VirK/YbjX family protein [Selenomonas sp. AE3005]